MKTLIVRCPSCQKQVIWTKDNPHKPFCSQRCKLIDFGAWANEEHRITTGETTLSDSKNE